MDIKDLSIIPYDTWKSYIAKGCRYNINKVGKWMFFFEYNDKLFRKYSKLCKISVLSDIVKQSKISNPNDSYDKCVCIFYCEYDDIETHKKIIKFMMDNELINKTKNGRYYNISFKLDNQTRQNEYGKDFKGVLKLEQFINLYTGKFII